MAFEQSYRQEHWTEEAPGIYTAQLFSPEAIRDLRAHLDAAATSRIPTRRPNGMNRYGLMLHPSDKVDGAVHLTEFEEFYQELVEIYLRPTARALFPAVRRPSRRRRRVVRFHDPLQHREGWGCASEGTRG